jgi:hypothetical protein
VLRRLLILASLVAAPGAVQAQFATFIPPKPPQADSVSAATAARQKAKADSATALRIANMKRWVDSAAGMPPRSTRTADSVLSAEDTTPVLVATAHGRAPQPIVERTEPERSVIPSAPPAPKKARGGEKAPATASSLPLLLLMGSISLTMGLLLLAGAPRAQERHA